MTERNTVEGMKPPTWILEDGFDCHVALPNVRQNLTPVGERIVRYMSVSPTSLSSAKFWTDLADEGFCLKQALQTSNPLDTAMSRPHRAVLYVIVGVNDDGTNLHREG